MRKVLVSLLVAAMVLGLVGTAFAGFTDVTGNRYVDMVAAFGWVNGYPDGTFKPEGNITRAEASAVVVRALGLDAAAEAAKGLGSKFSDVPGTHWASGYINVCTTKGILKGYPDGTFKPEANVTNAEIITMIVRALNRESEAIGEWPVGHITVAAANSIIGTGFASSAPATRGDVATYVGKSSNVKFLKLTTNGWEEDTTKTMALQNDLTRLKDVHVTDYDSDVNDPTITVNDGSGDKTWNMADKFVLGSGKQFRDLLGATVDVYYNDDDDVVLVDFKSVSSTKTGVIKSLGANYFYMDGDTRKYEMNATAVMYRNSIKLGTVAADFGLIKVDDNVEFTIENGLVTYLKATCFDTAHATVDSVRATGDISSQYIKLLRANVPFRYWMSQDTVVKLNGATAKLSDLKEDMVVSVQLSPTATDTALFIDATDKSVTGQVTAKRRTTTDGSTARYISVDGVEYRLESYAELYDVTYVNEDTTWNSIDIGDTVTAYLSVRGRARVIDSSTATAAYGKIISTATGADYDKWVVDVKGTEVTYEIDDNWTTWSATFNEGDYIKIEKNSKGRLINTTTEMIDKGLVTVDGAVKPVANPGDKVTEVYRTDKLIEVEDSLAVKRTFTINDSSVVYVDGLHSTISSITDDSRIRYVLKSDNRTIAFAVVDTVANVDKGSITAQAGGKIVGFEKAVEAGASIRVYATALLADTGLGSELKFDAGATSVSADSKGQFTLTMDAKLAGGADAGETVFVRVTDLLGTFTVLSITLK